MGALESRGVLRKMSDMLEMMVKRMDVLARLENSTDFRKAEEMHFPIDRSVVPVPVVPVDPGFTNYPHSIAVLHVE